MAELVLCLLFASLVALTFKGAIWALNLLVLAPLSDPLRRLPGPRAGYWEDHFWELMEYARVRSFPPSLTMFTKVSILAQTNPPKPTTSGRGSTARSGGSMVSVL